MTANVTVGADDTQKMEAETTHANVAEVLASTTLTIASLPAYNTVVTIGGCAVTFTATDTLNCSAGTATVGTATVGTTTNGSGVTVKPRSATDITNALLLLTGVKNATGSTTDLTVSASSSPTSVIFTTTANSEGSPVETGGKIKFVSTTGAITNPYSYAGVAAEKQVDMITLSGIVETGDIYRLIVTVGGITFSYIVPSTDTTFDDIASNGSSFFNSSIGGDVTTSSGHTIIVTAVEPGTPLDSYTVSAINRPAVAQVVTFTPANVTAGETFTITINGSNFSYEAASNDTVALVVDGLVSAISSSAVTCADSTTHVTCTAKVAGTSFSYSSTVASAHSHASGSIYRYPVVSPAVAPTIVFTKVLRVGNSNAEVKLLQGKLQALGFLGSKVKLTNYFGLQTRAALIKFQKANNLKPANGLVDTKTRALLNNLPTITSAVAPAAANTLPTTFTKVLRIGTSDAEVNLLQQKLQTLGFLGSKVKLTKYFGLQTRTALIKFQKANNLKPANGLVDTKTRALLNSL